MNKESLKVVNDINRAIIKARGIYSEWSARHGISYHEMLVLYTIREFGFCTQKQICDSYLLPRQTMNNVITRMRKDGLLEYSSVHSIGREKAFVLSEKGTGYIAPLDVYKRQVPYRPLPCSVLRRAGRGFPLRVPPLGIR